jgi:hypothetical protein
MLELWDDLERWANHDKDGSLGVFEARIAGKWIHVGLPLAQTILTEQERRSLPAIFFQAGLDPTGIPPEAELRQALRAQGEANLRSRTLKLLNTKDDDESYGALLAAVAEELLGWDGEVPNDSSTPLAQGVRSFAIVRLAVHLDSVAQTASCALRLKINREFPDHPLTLSSSSALPPLVCDDSFNGWSTELRTIGNDLPADASCLDWREGLIFTEESLRWRLKFAGRPIRLLVKAEFYQLPGLVEASALPRSSPFYLLYHRSVSETVMSWLQRDCQGVRQYSSIAGLATGWAMAMADLAKNDSISRDYPFLSFPNGLRVLFAGGLRSAAGNNFFAFAPPRIVIDGGDGSENVKCNGMDLSPTPTASFTYELPKSLPVDTRISVEVLAGERVVRRSLYLSSEFQWRFSDALAHFDCWNMPTQSSEPSFAGPRYFGAERDLSMFRRQPLFVLDPDEELNRVFFVGTRPGQITSWPTQPIADDWNPVWAIPLGRKGTAIFCGDNPSNCRPGPPVLPRGESTELWREVLWHGRKRVLAPEELTLRKLWQEYVEAARDV